MLSSFCKVPLYLAAALTNKKCVAVILRNLFCLFKNSNSLQDLLFADSYNTSNKFIDMIALLDS